MPNTKDFFPFERLFLRLLRLVHPDLADLRFYRRQCEIYEKIIIPQMSQEAREAILRLKEENRQAVSAFHELKERHGKIENELFEIRGENSALIRQFSEKSKTLNGQVKELLVQMDLLKQRERLDGLTQLLNREGIAGAFYRVAGNMRRTAERMKGTPDISMLFIDIDTFKEINDTHGHQKGDEMLITVANLMRDSFRPSDILGRIGGDEFLVVLPNANAAEAKGVAEKFRKKIEQHPFFEFIGIGLTVSIGVARAYLDGNLDPDQALYDAKARADAAMYEAKKIGRNAVCVAEDVQEARSLSSQSKQMLH
jgi:diguanylate cyclase (GGDEF)-like protein